MTITRSERETILRWDDTTDDAILYTASPVIARRWEKRGYTLTPVQTHDGTPTGWETRAPKNAILVKLAPHLRKPRPEAGFAKQTP